MALSDYTLGKSKPQSFYDFTPEGYSLDSMPEQPPSSPGQSIGDSLRSIGAESLDRAMMDYGAPQASTSSWGYTPPVYSAPELETPSGTSGQWWKNQGVGDWGKSGGGRVSGVTGFSPKPQPWIKHRAPPPDVPELTPYEMPERGTAPVFEAPEWDKSEINRLSQEHAAAPIRTLREAYQRTAARLPTNPQSRLLLKDALAGYGAGLESAISGARRTARGEYGEEYGRAFQAEGMQYRGDVREFEADYATRLAQVQQQTEIENRNKMMQYQADYAEYLRGYKK